MADLNLTEGDDTYEHEKGKPWINIRALGGKDKIIIHGNSLEHVTDAYKRFLEGRFRKAFNLEGTPLRIEMKTSSNPFAGKDD